MTYEALDITGGKVKGDSWQEITMKFDDGSDDSNNYYAQFIESKNLVVPLVTMTSQITEEDSTVTHKTKLYKLKCNSLTECEMVSKPRCMDDFSCGDDYVAKENVKTSTTGRVRPYTAYRL